MKYDASIYAGTTLIDVVCAPRKSELKKNLSNYGGFENTLVESNTGYSIYLPDGSVLIARVHKYVRYF